MFIPGARRLIHGSIRMVNFLSTKAASQATLRSAVRGALEGWRFPEEPRTKPRSRPAAF